MKLSFAFICFGFLIKGLLPIDDKNLCFQTCEFCCRDHKCRSKEYCEGSIKSILIAGLFSPYIFIKFKVIIIITFICICFLTKFLTKCMKKRGIKSIELAEKSIISTNEEKESSPKLFSLDPEFSIKKNNFDFDNTEAEDADFSDDNEEEIY